MESRAVLARENFSTLIDSLNRLGYRIVGPTVKDGAIIYDPIRTVNDLPIGWTDETEAGKYRIKRRNDEALFGYNVGPHSWKKYLFPPRRRLWQAKRDGKTLQIEEEQLPQEKLAFLGMRACEIQALFVQDKVFQGDTYKDSYYQSVRQQLFIIGTNCTQAGGTCFCVSMKTGPQCTSGYDLVLTEILDGERHEFVLEAGTEQGRGLLTELPTRATTSKDETNVEEGIKNATKQMGRRLDTTGIKELLSRNYENPRWQEVAERCLTCANCTMVCPTCFCSQVEDTSDLTGDHAERWRSWDSCFTMDFSYVHGGSVRSSTLSRYRQWVTHKLGTWHDQFGTSGCVGCGRCIAWCPVGIDITEETAAIRKSEDRGADAK